MPLITQVEQLVVSVPESASLVRAGVTVREGDSVRLAPNSTATIWSGVLLHGRTGPAGYDWSDQDPRFPLRSQPYRPYSLLYKFVVDPDTIVSITVAGMTLTVPRHEAQPWTYLGNQSVSFVASEDGGLFFRTNDDMPGNGDGAFQVSVTVEHRS